MNKTTPDSVDSATPEPDATVAAPPAVPLNDVVLVMPQRIGDFTIVRILGEGGMGTVYLAEDRRLGRKAAIKTMKHTLAAKPENRVRFVREARAAAAVEHDNIVPVWQIGEMADGSPFIAMPFLQGEMLEARLKREPIQNIGIVLKVAREVSEGLAAAHARGLIHRDIKPGNIWIEGEPDHAELARQVRRCKILDFGLARSAEFEDVQITANGTIVGTPTYMAPEQASGHKVDHRADLFSLGVLLYRMSTGKLPFTGSNTMAVLCALATVTPPPALKRNPNLPPALSDLIDKLLSKDPAGRPQTAAEVATAVRGIIKELQARKSGPAVAVAIAAPVHHDHPTETLAPFTGLEPDQIIALKHAPAPQPQTKARRSRLPWLLVLALPALIPLIWWLTTVLLRVETPTGTLIVEINDPETEARIKDGKLILTGPDDKVRYTLSPSEHDKKIDAGPYKIRVEGADGLKLDTPEFTLKKGDQITVRVTAVPKKAEPKAVAKTLDADRLATEWVLSIGGTVKVNGENKKIKALTDLPKSFQLTGIDLEKNGQVSDASLSRFTNCINLMEVLLGSTEVTYEGLDRLKDCKNLTYLGLQKTRLTIATIEDMKKALPKCKIEWDGGVIEPTASLNPDHAAAEWVLSIGGVVRLNGKGSDSEAIKFAASLPRESFELTWVELDKNKRVSDAELAALKDCKNVRHLNLNETNVSDLGLAHCRDFRNLTGLNLSGTQVSDAGLAYFKDCKLACLNLGTAKVTDAGLAHFKECTSLKKLILNRTPVTDVGLEYFRECKNLDQISLYKVNATDAGVDHFKDLKKLTYLDLAKTKVTAAKIEELHKALPRCRIEWDGGVIQPTASLDPDREAAEWVLSIGGGVKVNDEDSEIKAIADLPTAPYRLRNVDLQKNQLVSDAGIVHFKDCKNLVNLNLGATKVSDSGLAYFKDCRDLERLILYYTQVTDAGLANFTDCKKLTDLNLSNTKVSDTGCALFKDNRNLNSLNVAGTNVSDMGLDNFKECKILTWLLLRSTKVTAAKIEELHKALPQCKIEWDGGVIEPSASANK